MPNPLRITLRKEIEDLTSRFVKSTKAKPKDRSEDLSTINTGGKSDIDRSKINLENKKIIEGHKDKDRTKTNEGLRGVDGHEPKKVKDLSNVLDSEPVTGKKEVKSENLYEGFKKFIRKTDNLTNVYTKK
jgi:hypothetical protein